MSDVETLRSRVAAFQHHVQMYPDDLGARRELDRLEVALDVEERKSAERGRRLAKEEAKWRAEAEAREQRRAAREKQREQERREREQQDAERLEAQLRAKYTAAAPGQVSDWEWMRVREQLLHQHRVERMNQTEEQVAEAKRRYRF